MPLQTHSNVPNVLETLPRHPQVVFLKTDFDGFVKKFIHKEVLQDWAYALEICEQMLKIKLEVRVHIHFSCTLQTSKNFGEELFHFKNTRQHRARDFEHMTASSSAGKQHKKYVCWLLLFSDREKEELSEKIIVPYAQSSETLMKKRSIQIKT